MQSYLGILSADTLSRDGYVIAFEALEKGIADNAVQGIPSLIEHDFHRPVGWIFPFGIIIEPKISKTVGNFLLSETIEDSELIIPKIQSFWKNKNYEACQNHIERFKNLLKGSFSPNGNFIDNGCISYNLDGIAEKFFPDLFSLDIQD